MEVTQHFNQLTEAEQERLAILMEEAGEVIQMCGKILRHGYNSFHPDDEKKTTNTILLSGEIGDLLAAIDMIGIDINTKYVGKSKASRPNRLAPYTHHQKDSHA